MTTIITKQKQEMFDELYRTLQEDRPLMSLLDEMQAEKGISKAAAAANAGAVTRMVAEYETLGSMLSRNADSTFEVFLKYSERMNGYDRKVLLHQLYFGLKLYQDPELAEKRLNGVDVDTLFRDYYARWGEDPSITAAQLEEQIREMIGSYHISPEAMRLLARKLEKGKDLLATSAALGEQGYRFKCLAAMELYLRSGNTMTMEEAVSAACADVDAQAAADAVSSGMIAEDRAKKILALIVLAMSLYGAYYLFAGVLKTPVVDATLYELNGSEPNLTDRISEEMFGRMGEEARVRETGELGNVIRDAFREYTESRTSRIQKEQIFGLRWLTGAGMIFGFSEDLARFAGRLTARHQLTRSVKESQAAEAMHAMANREIAGAKAAGTPQAERVQEDGRREVHEQKKAVQTPQIRVFG